MRSLVKTWCRFLATRSASRCRRTRHSGPWIRSRAGEIGVFVASPVRRSVHAGGLQLVVEVIEEPLIEVPAQVVLLDAGHELFFRHAFLHRISGARHERIPLD